METSVKKALFAGLFGGLLSAGLCFSISHTLSQESTSSGNLSRSLVMKGSSPSKYPPQYVLEPGLSGQRVTTVADAAVWSEGGSAAGISPMTPDGGIVTCNGTACGANGVTYTPGTGALTFPSTATAPGLYQPAESTDVAPNAMTIAARGANLAAVTNVQGANLILEGGPGATSGGLAGDVIISGLSAGTTIGTGGALIYEVAGQKNFEVYSYNNLTTAMWLGIGNNYGSLGDANFYTNGSGLQIGPGASGSVSLNASGGATYEIINTNVVEVGSTATGSAYGGTSVFIIDPGTAPTSPPTGKTALNTVASVGLVATSASLDSANFIAPTTGTHNTQALLSPMVSNEGRTTAGSGTYVALTLPIASGTFCIYEMVVYFKLITPGTGGGTAGNALSGLFRCGFENQGGTLTPVGGAQGCVQSTDSASNWADTAMASALTGVSGSASGGNVVIGFMTSSTSGVMDYVARNPPGSSYCE